ncbi:M20/M25/M40 family metallo-hydrolase [Sphingomonas sp. LaA6.9]|uniref:M20/M25/M40 family metallo-hydrolase n=1 Tax=Sphingomonas sp. LaA6.9 TaxID=2919914 RepID=UPI001F4F74C9|nr:M20/M25/M40 family metallo-hydrolase [Sphingomonas sp. LaA6.9]MCJ8156621.1 M20/M25/M40 family metallo-hydrolase [Sphingomonas sp. LaA6.9]
MTDHGRDMAGSIDRRTMMKSGGAAAALLTPGLALAASANADRTAVLKAIDTNQAASVQRLADWIKLPSIAAEKRNIDEGVAHMIALARDAGFPTAMPVPTGGVPSVFATLDVGAKHWIGIYFMYDVKQFDPAEWTSPPLEARLVDRPGLGQVMVGRGAVNQKGPEMAFLAAVRAFRESGKKLPVNIALIAEGEEEIASPNFAKAISHPDVLPTLKRCVGVFIPSASQSPDGTSTLTLGAKGAVELELISSGERWGRGPTKDIHSSNFARVDSPAWRLVQALDTLMKPDGHTIAVEGWYDNVQPLSPREKALIAETARRTSEAEVKKQLGVSRWINDESWGQALERLASQPTINIQGLVAGYTGPGGKTILPHRAVAKMEFRLAPAMTKEEAIDKFNAHLKKHGFEDLEVKITGGYGPTSTKEDSALVRAEKAVMERLGVAYTIIPRSAGSWPGVMFSGPPLNLPAAQWGMGHGSGAHGPDEYFLIRSANPKVMGMAEASKAYVELLYEIANQATIRA